MPKVVTDTQVFESVIKMIETHGYSGATTKQIAEAANINEVTLFRKYGSKAQLVKEAITYYGVQSGAETAATYTGDLEADLNRVVAAYQSTEELHAKVFPAIMAEMARFPELNDAANAPLGVVTKIAQLIAQYQAEGRLRSENPMQAVGALLGPLIVNSMLRKAQVIDQAVNLEEHVTAYLYGRVLP